LIAGVFCWRLAPDGAYPSVALYSVVLPVSAFVLGVVLLLTSGFIDLLTITNAETKAATERQKAKLSRVMGGSVIFITVTSLAVVLMLVSPLADGRFGWGGTTIATSLYFACLAVLPLLWLWGTLLRFREIDILTQPD
jgi:protein-S-isoprenylcysteine O-methyltransferase Ste14